jgi:hypothetical protein
MQARRNLFAAIFVTVTTEVGLGVLMSIPFAAAYLPIVCLYSGVFAVFLHYEQLSKRIDGWFTQLPNCVIKAVWLLGIVGVLTLVCAIIAFKFEPIAWLRIFPDKAPVVSGFSLHIGFSAFVSAACVLLYTWQVHAEKNKPSNRRGDKVLSWVIEYLRDETTAFRGKSNEYLTALLTVEVETGRLHLWGRRNSKDVFIRPKDFKIKHYVFELHNNQYRLCSLRDGSVVWGPTFIEREIKERWPQIKPPASD